MLPDSKAELPKCLYLDANKWIDLARAHYGRTDGKQFEKAAQAIAVATGSGNVITPVSLVNAIESTASWDSGRRERLAIFIVEFSKNTSILPYSTVASWEIKNAVRKLFGKTAFAAIRPNLVRRGLISALGCELRVSGTSESKMNEILEYANSRDGSVMMLREIGNHRDIVKQARAAETEILSVFEHVRAINAPLTSKQRRVVEFAELFGGATRSAQELNGALAEIGVGVSEFKARLKTSAEWELFFEEMPAINTLVTLIGSRDRDLERPIAANDVRDLIALSVAIPYSNIVVAEKYWAHHARASNLDEEYATVIMTDLRELPKEFGASMA